MKIEGYCCIQIPLLNIMFLDSFMLFYISVVVSFHTG
jgi:hypothetical protein